MAWLSRLIKTCLVLFHMSAQTVEASDFSTELSHESTNMAYHLLGSYQNSIYLGSITTDYGSSLFLAFKKNATLSYCFSTTQLYSLVFFKKKNKLLFQIKTFFFHLTISEQDSSTQRKWLSTTHSLLNCDLNGTQPENRSERSS